MRKIFIDPANIDFSLVREIAAVISKGAIAALPTETVYGLAVVPDNAESVNKLHEIKKRPSRQPFTLALSGIEKATNYFVTLPPFGYRLIEKFWPGPLTIVYYSSDDEKMGIRVPAHVIMREILKELPAGVYLPSANISGEKEAISASEVETIFDGRIDLIVDGGKSLYGKSSTVVDLTSRPFKILREGVVSEKEIIDVFIKKRILLVCTGNSCRSPMAQFLLKKYLEEDKPYLKGMHEIISRGIGTHSGLRASSTVVELLREKEGLNIVDFTPKRLDSKAILSSDFIFTMEDAQTEHILRLEPTAEGRIFGLKKFLPQELEKDIPDPIGRDYEFYEEVYLLIKKAILELRDWL
ncbi:MAG: L-threonylcarbamoyladenylate synthase [Candidatus Omnitrophota bacterium]|nr:L-threonylcarbamoyladenylate synthase [Candidatus Omnitrophota bacterium]